MESLTWMLSFASIALWMLVGFELLVTPPAVPRGWRTRSRRLLWAVAWAVALVGGSWGPGVWSRGTSDFADDPAVGPPFERSEGVLRTPFALRTSANELDAEGRTIRREERLTLQLPVVLLAFFVTVLVVRRREARAPTPGGRDGGGSGPTRDADGPDERGPSGAARAAGTAALALLILLGACSQDEPLGRDAPRPDRRVVEPAWDTLVHLRLEPEDTLLFSADHLEGSERGFWVLDRIGRRVAHFGWDGEPRWFAGRAGGGPGEFLNPRTIQIDGRDRVWVLDIGNHRITGFDPDGRMVDEVSLQSLDAVIHGFAVDEQGERFFGMVHDDRLRPVTIDRDSRVDQGPPIGVPDAGGEWGLALQGAVTGARSGADWVYAFTMGDGFFRMRGLEPMDRRTLYPEWIPFPGVETHEESSGTHTSTSTRLTEPNFSARGVSVSGGRVFVPFHGESELARRIVDVYELASGEYLETLLVPRGTRISAWGERLLLTWSDPAPEVLVLERRLDG